MNEKFIGEFALQFIITEIHLFDHRMYKVAK